MTKKTSTTWKPGQSGNAMGKPTGCRNKATMMVLSLMEQGAEEITQAVVNAARAGDLSAARLVLERLAPPMRERPISIALPDTATSGGIDKAAQTVLKAAATGELLLGEAQALSGIIEGRRKAMETFELEQRITALENKNGKD
ncbi:MAG: DUF5681 domain-containing protein [Pseudomonadota bacterium]|nr:DUF5681 domain-containing protein [Pseudomonadota bacterium]